MIGNQGPGDLLSGGRFGPDFDSPAPSRAPSRVHTPLSHVYRQKFALSEGTHDPRSRSGSRARPGRFLPAEAVFDIPPTHRAARFTSPVKTPGPDGALNGNSALKNSASSPVRAQSDGLGDISYAKDELGEETAEMARVWQVYTDEAAKADSALTEGCNRSIDVLLVFTGLFSAVLTTFIIQSYQLMIPDATETTNALLAQLVALQSPSSVPLPITKTTGSASRQVHWVNGLWFAALSCSLSTALISMLAKQWMQAYLPNVSGSPRHRARQRQSRYMQLVAWHVLAIVNALPLLLHVALLLFFAGLVVLLWSADIGITLATWFIVAMAYIFYFASIWLSLAYPDCPYQHPISEHLRKWMVPKVEVSTREMLVGSSRQRKDVETALPSSFRSRSNCSSPDQSRHMIEDSDDKLDAAALIWLFTKSPDNDVVAAALQAIAGLPRDFSAFQMLREAGAQALLEQGFQTCFHKDTTLDLQWHLTDPEGAELYCRGWLRLTRGTLEKWPFEILEPLWMLQDLKSHPDVAAIASCAVALSSFDSHMSQWELLSYLAKYAAGEVQLSQPTQSWLVDSIIECIVSWEMPNAVIEETTLRAVPIMLRMLHLTEDLPTSNVRSAVALALYVFTCGHVNLAEYQSEDRRRAEYCELTVAALSMIVKNPDRFGVKDSLLDITARELSRLASPVVARSERFPHALRDVAKASLSKLYVEGRIGVGVIPDTIMADVLHLLFPPVNVPDEHRPQLVTSLVETLWMSTHPEITSWSVRLLEVLLLQCPIPVSQAFVDSDGINAVLRSAKAGDIDSRRLQIDSLRTLCTFIDSSTSLYFQDKLCMAMPSGEGHLDPIFQSAFFETLCSVVSSRRWWLFEVSGHWMPALVHLCHLRPQETVWRTVVKVFRDFADRNEGEDGYTETLSHLDTMLSILKRNGARSGYEVERVRTET